MDVVVKEVDYTDSAQMQQLVSLLDQYARDPMGGGEGLKESVKQQLPSAMSARNDLISGIVYCDDEPAGLINCVEGFSTFNANAILNIHDVVVLEPYRGKGLSRRLFEFAEGVARDRGCCKVTLEVLDGNEVAKAAYARFGYGGYELGSDTGQALFWQKKLV